MPFALSCGRADSAAAARRERAKKISPVISRNLQANQRVGKIITGNNRRLFSAICRLFDRERASTRACARTDALARRRMRAESSRATRATPSTFLRIPMPACLTSMRAIHKRETAQHGEGNPRAQSQKKRNANEIRTRADFVAETFQRMFLRVRRLGRSAIFRKYFLIQRSPNFRRRCQLTDPHG